MPITLNDNTIGQIKELAVQAYGHGSASAGRGRIGMIGGHVVKFNTHLGERLSRAGSMDDMRASCEALRTHLSGIVTGVYKNGISDGMKKVLAKLGLAADGTVLPGPKDLLSRSVVVKFIDQLKCDTTNLTAGMDNVRGGETVEHSTLRSVTARTLSADVKTAVENEVKSAFAGHGNMSGYTNWQLKISNAMTAVLSANMTVEQAMDDVCKNGLSHSNLEPKVMKEKAGAIENFLNAFVQKHAGLRLLCAREKFKAPVRGRGTYSETPFNALLFNVKGSSDGLEKVKSIGKMNKAFSDLFRETELFDKVLSGEITKIDFSNNDIKQFFLDGYLACKDLLVAGYREVGAKLNDDKVAEKMDILLGACVTHKKKGGEGEYEVKIGVSKGFENNNLHYHLQKRLAVLAECVKIQQENPKAG